MQRVQYVGPYEEVVIPDAANQKVIRGQVVELLDELAESLLGQEANWTKATATKSAPAAEKE